MLKDNKYFYNTAHNTARQTHLILFVNVCSSARGYDAQ
jgi:hypothetical protein